jgi:dihydrofolate reductase
MAIKVSLIVAMAQNNCIGKDNKMPWHISEDLKRFKSLTVGHPVIMGRKTYESILGYLSKPLPGRTNIVVSRKGFTPEGTNENLHDIPVFDSLEKAIAHGQKIAKSEVFIIGGAQIYGQAIYLADIIYLTQIHEDVSGDAFFPEIDQKIWTETAREDHLANSPPFSFITLVKS